MIEQYENQIRSAAASAKAAEISVPYSPAAALPGAVFNLVS
jgi:hypothetical protein